MSEFLWHQPIEDRDALMHRVLLFPGRGLHLLKAAAHDDGDLLAPQPARRAAAIHRRIAAAEHHDAAADLIDVTEGDAGEPIDADMDVAGCFLASGDFEIASSRRSATDEYRIPIVRQQRLQAADEFPEAGLDIHVEDQVDLFVGDRFRQAEARDLCPHHAAALGVAVEQHAVIAERHQIARDSKRGRAGPDEGNALAVFLAGDGGQIGADVALVIGGDAL